jgi:hypothetical protein
MRLLWYRHALIRVAKLKPLGRLLEEFPISY